MNDPNDPVNLHFPTETKSKGQVFVEADHFRFYEEKGWSHGADCVCKLLDLKPKN